MSSPEVSPDPSPLSTPGDHSPVRDLPQSAALPLPHPLAIIDDSCTTRPSRPRRPNFRTKPRCPPQPLPKPDAELVRRALSRPPRRPSVRPSTRPKPAPASNPVARRVASAVRAFEDPIASDAFIPRGYAATPSSGSPASRAKLSVPQPAVKPGRRAPRRRPLSSTALPALVLPPRGTRLVVPFKLDVVDYLATLRLDVVITIQHVESVDSLGASDLEPWTFDSDAPGSEASAASPAQLYSALFASQPRDEYWRYFLAVYRVFMEPIELLHRLFLSMHPSNTLVSLAHARMALDFLVFWVSHQYADFLAASRLLLAPLRAFKDAVLAPSELDVALLEASLQAAAHAAADAEQREADVVTAAAKLEVDMLDAEGHGLATPRARSPDPHSQRPTVPVRSNTSPTDTLAAALEMARMGEEADAAATPRKSRFGTLKRKKKKREAAEAAAAAAAAGSDSSPQNEGGALDAIAQPRQRLDPRSLFDVETGDAAAFAQQTSELLGLAWSKPGKEDAAPHVLQLIRSFNTLSGWVASVVVRESKVKVRGELIGRFIDLAYEFTVANNMNGMMAVMAGLSSSQVHRLRKSWQRVDDSRWAVYESLKALIAPAKNFRIMRSKLATAAIPCLPYLGMFLTDLTFAYDAVRQSVDGKYYFADFVPIAKILLAIQRHQDGWFSWQPLPKLRLFIDKYMEVLPDEDAYALSLAHEPRK
ncbi:uncharacterized protein AMSG_07457 [Thecamonas trahens ATCC 50062]|uniref:Uncharacterized protein n=1 Tax=Thecamonas trahens ATCC 50062 TaxID=461836 RepID=A0A0L0DGV2_THETB|nr:hypothetical protein AMSG_07457 [Thecamonas trahens ATCC 50062]KNC51557.1 hypothetical protein AMSG_07457 [Thecamonas trahens ATCC 50062]|eukprot:XP_013755959.1 hypothetical protein AMSG_07457 [Thecamonas trahens ATCC 50062]